MRTRASVAVGVGVGVVRELAIAPHSPSAYQKHVIDNPTFEVLKSEKF